ncbi:MAG TPA: ferrous iron transport protein A [Clostridium sp.]|jgi:ferrous iron transport protein A|uniref:Ferrous iron transport protein A n=1 Tax=Clostridium lapidicellarium TaxID=3240931 RepID=A0ABV4DUC5_9CLOT|nr:FeoA family protein [uncultured Clostridium sp.]NLU06956.1 ferrous iron transport protein A [Clostridiales bacterium]HBC96540.1 ferrous iron transport protein A [Clostridium sp.]
MEKLCHVNVGKTVIVKQLFSKNLLRERMMALGITKGTLIKVVLKGPGDNLTLYKIRDTLIALRKEEASLIAIQQVNFNQCCKGE